MSADTYHAGHGARVTKSGLAPRAAAVLAAVLLPALAIDAAALVQVLQGEGSGSLGRFALVATAAAGAQLTVLITPRNQSYHTSIALVLAGVLLLPWQLVVLVPLVQHVPEWIRKRYAWYIQTFNIANYTLASLAAWLVADAVRSDPHDLRTRFAVAGVLAALVFVAVNHGVLAVMLRVARGHRLRQ